MGKNRVGFGPCEKRLFLLCWTAYFATYICRLNFSAVMPELNTLGLFTKAQMASVSSCFFITYGVGQFINGFLGDRIAPRRLRGAAVFLGDERLCAVDGMVADPAPCGGVL